MRSVKIVFPLGKFVKDQAISEVYSEFYIESVGIDMRESDRHSCAQDWFLGGNNNKTIKSFGEGA